VLEHADHTEERVQARRYNRPPWISRPVLMGVRHLAKLILDLVVHRLGHTFFSTSSTQYRAMGFWHSLGIDLAFHHAPLSNAEGARGSIAKHTVGRTALRLKQSSADQFAFPKAIAAGVETVVLPVHLEFEDALASTQGVAASAASVPEAVAAEDFLRVFARQDASVKFLVNQVDQPEITDTH
jgi:hypothetical protein